MQMALQGTSRRGEASLRGVTLRSRPHSHSMWRGSRSLFPGGLDVLIQRRPATFCRRRILIIIPPEPIIRLIEPHLGGSVSWAPSQNGWVSDWP